MQIYMTRSHKLVKKSDKNVNLADSQFSVKKSQKHKLKWQKVGN